MKGGARINSGPPPDENALRRDRPSDRAGWTMLPADGYAGPVPEWPLRDDVVLTARRDLALADAERLVDELAAEDNGRKRGSLEKQLREANREVLTLDRLLEAQQQLQAELWGDLWRLPQAAVWIDLGWTRDVAQYVRHKVLGELGELADAKEARQWSDRLGLNPAAMLRNRWKVAVVDDDDAPTGPAPAADGAPAPARPSARDRLKVVRPDDADE